jgi:hypothetical protein
MGLRVSISVLPGVRLSGPPKKPVRSWHRNVKTPVWVAVATLVVAAGCASEEPTGTPASVGASPASAEATSSAYMTTTPPLLPQPLPPPPRAASQCDPNYSGACVPIASDVDCAGGSGNGPAYVRGPVNVVGEDIYGLDGKDGDGVGCES